MTLPADPAAALALVQEASRSATVVVFKQSPICPISRHAEAEWDAYLAGRGPDAPPLCHARIDVIAERPLARGLTAALGIRHESPQALLFRAGALVWHDSHERLTLARFRDLVDTPQPTGS
jgi:bacillithiol system protein YtxJ